jgi:flagellar hook-length control protein FliK
MTAHDAVKAVLPTVTTSTSGFSTYGHHLANFSNVDSVIPAAQDFAAQTSSARTAPESVGIDLSIEDLGIKATSEQVDTLGKSGKLTDDLAGLWLAGPERERANPGLVSKRGSETLAAIQGLAAHSVNHSSPTYSTPSQTGAAELMAARTPVASDAWGRDIGEKVLWMAAQNLSEAEIQLDPPELGPLQARISVQNDQAQVSFNSNSALVREALDQTAHRLRDMFSSEGLNLVDVNVSDQQQHERSEQGDEVVANNELNPERGDEGAPELTASKQILNSQFIVDQFV